MLNIPSAMLPEVLDCAADFGTAKADILGAEIPVCGVAGDQQAATIGQACFEPGMFKSTYGTGCFALLNTGADMVASKNRMLTTIAYRLGGETTYALEGSIFMAGASVQWLRDGLGIIDDAAQSGAMAEKADPEQQVYLVPAFVGLGAPHWDANARGAMFGLTRGTGPNEIAKATLEAVCYQTRDLLEAMYKDWGTGRGPRHDAARRRRHGGVRLDDAVPRRHSRRAGRPAAGAGDDGARRGVAGRVACRRVAGPRRLRQDLGAGKDLHAAMGEERGRANMPAGRMRWEGR
jgi:glycerol kinase